MERGRVSPQLSRTRGTRQVREGKVGCVVGDPSLVPSGEPSPAATRPLLGGGGRRQCTGETRAVLESELFVISCCPTRLCSRVEAFPAFELLAVL